MASNLVYQQKSGFEWQRGQKTDNDELPRGVVTREVRTYEAYRGPLPSSCPTPIRSRHAIYLSLRLPANPTI
jgi:hypothetical protein